MFAAALRTAPPGAIGGFPAHLLVDMGRPIDRRFATSVFVYRSGDAINDALLARLPALAPRTLARELDRRPPAALVSGHEGASELNRVSQEDLLDAWARTRGYRLTSGPDGGRLWVAPGQLVRPARLEPAKRPPLS